MTTPTPAAPVRYPIICDLDGVIWLADDPIPGSADAVARLRAAGHRVLFVTNFSFGLPSEIEEKLATHGIEAVGDVVTSAQAAVALVRAGERVQVCAGPGVRSEVERRGAIVVDREGPADAVIVGFHRTFDYDAMRCAATAVRRGARLIGTNDDATYPTPDGPIPGGGAILASVATGAGVQPTVAGKPYAPMADLVRELLGSLPPGTIMVGDRPDTDGRFARTLGCRFGLVHTGVSRPGERVDPAPELEAPDLTALADLVLAER